MSRAGHKPRYGLRDSPLFRLRTRKNLAQLLRVSLSTLNALTKNPELYKRCWKHKKLKNHESGAWLNSPPSVEQTDDYRPIDKPNQTLKQVQSRISNLLSRVTPPDFLFNPVKGRSYVDNAARHKGAVAVRGLNVADYFPNCTANKVAHFFSCDLECSPDVTAMFVRLTTWKESLPQGSPCSPILAYFVHHHMWAEINSLVESMDCKFSLYADDLTISGSIVREERIWHIKQIVHRHGLQLNPKKEASVIKKPADITGAIVSGERTLLPNRQRKMLLETKKRHQETKSAEEREALSNQIAGRMAQQRQVEKPDTDTPSIKNL